MQIKNRLLAIFTAQFTGMPSFLIAEDHSVVRMGTALTIRSLYKDALIAEAETFDDAIILLQSQKFDLMIMDIHMPGGDSLQMIPAVKLRQPDIHILIFSSYDEKLYAMRYLKAGAKGFLNKGARPETISAAIQATLQGETYLSQDLQRRLLDDALGSGGQKNSELLSAREIEVMQLLVRGARTSEIKQELNIQNSTVSTYKTRIFEKMGVSNVVELVEKVKIFNANK